MRTPRLTPTVWVREMREENKSVRACSSWGKRYDGNSCRIRELRCATPTDLKVKCIPSQTDVRRWLLPEKSGAGPHSVSPEGNASHTSPLQPPPKAIQTLQQVMRTAGERAQEESVMSIPRVCPTLCAHTSLHAWTLVPTSIPLPSPCRLARIRTNASDTGLPSGNDDISRPSPS
jgi:hypothetical protein